MKIAEEIKATKNLSIKTYFLSSYLISNRISPYISEIYIKLNISPNTITIHMILSGFLGAIYFAIPNIFIKIIGALFIHLWFILDCSDGEVARYTKKYSKYGKELDYMAHLINHPLFGIALFFSLYQLKRYDFYTLIFIVIASNFIDYFTRNLVSLNEIINLKSKIDNKGFMPGPGKWTLKKVILFIINIFAMYPNLVLFGVIIYFFDYFIGTDILFNYLVLNIIFSGMLSIYSVYKLTKMFYKS